jgi:MFS family permease
VAATAGGQWRDVLTRPLATCFGISAAIHSAIYLLNTTLPVHLVALGGSKAQVGMLFSVSTGVSMILRPVVGGLTDRYGFRPVALPGVLALALTLAALDRAASPVVVIALMTGLGLANGLVATSAGVLVARASLPEHRGEALSTYYVASSLGFSLGPPLGFALYRAGGMRLDLMAAAALAALIGLLAWSITGAATRPVPGPRPHFRFYSRRALPVAGALILNNIGHSSIYAFLPLYALAHGLGGNIGWFYALSSAWIIVCRVLLRRASDRLGRASIIVPAMALIAASFFVLAIPPTVPSLAAAALLLGSGVSVLYPTLLALLVDRTPEAERGLAIGTLSASFDVGIVIGSLAIGFTVEQTSYGVGFVVAGTGAIFGLATFVMTERRHGRRRVVPRPPAGV